jgi:hypothetical protein
MRKLIAAVVLSLAAVALAACDMPTLNVASQVNLNTEAGIIAGYGVVLNAERAYKSLPLCKTGTKPSVTNICAKRSVVVRLQNADRVANTAINQMTQFVKNNPNISPDGYLGAARSAILSIQTILNAEAVATNGSTS